eukprot:358364-Chlamydomonas_euryale.AAC.10
MAGHTYDPRQRPCTAGLQRPLGRWVAVLHACTQPCAPQCSKWHTRIRAQAVSLRRAVTEGSGYATCSARQRRKLAALAGVTRRPLPQTHRHGTRGQTRAAQRVNDTAHVAKQAQPPESPARLTWPSGLSPLSPPMRPCWLYSDSPWRVSQILRLCAMPALQICMRKNTTCGSAKCGHR